MELKDLPLGIPSFSDLRQADLVYVDKTALIYNLVRVPKGYYFLSRPRRFGKTLLLSTFESLFSHGLRDFKGLAIEKLWTETQTYPVIRLDFSSCNSFETLEEFEKQFDDTLYKAVIKSGIGMPPSSQEKEDLCSTMLWRFCTALDQASEQQPVLLIDEYDAPLNACIGKSELFKKVANKVSQFFIFLKASCSCLRFFFMTGICNYQLFRVFSSGTFIKNISFSIKYSTLLGYTEEELIKYFHPYIENAAKTNGISFEDCLTRMKENYGGYCFENRAETRVFNPWSILNFLKKPQLGFKNYWTETGTKTEALINYIKAYSLKIPKYDDHDPLIWYDALGPANEFDSENGLALLTHTGCLSIKDRVSKSLAEISYPNAEVSEFIAKLMQEQCTPNNEL